MIPQILNSGDTWSWTDSLADYPAPTWVLTHYFSGPQLFSVIALASGTDHASTATAAVTGTYKPGVYDWHAKVSSGSEIFTVSSGRLTVNPNLSDASQEHRSFWRQVLDELEPVILGKAGTDQLSMSIAGRSLQRMNWDELLAVYDRATTAVAADLGDAPGRVYVRLNRP